MKVYSWKTLIITIFLGGGYFAYIVYRFDGFHDLVLLACLAYLIIEGLSVSFIESAYKKDIQRSARMKRVYRKLFGKFAPLAPWAPLILFLLSFCVAKLLPARKGLILLLLLSALALAIYISIISRKHLKIEEQQEQREQEQKQEQQQEHEEQRKHNEEGQ